MILSLAMIMLEFSKYCKDSAIRCGFFPPKRQKKKKKKKKKKKNNHVYSQVIGNSHISSNVRRMQDILKKLIGKAFEKIAENGFDYRRKWVIYVLTILYISRRSNLLWILNKQITTDCFVLIYSPCFSIMCWKESRRKNNPILLPHFIVIWA